MAEEDPPLVEHALLRATDAYVNPSAPALRRVLIAAFDYSSASTRYNAYRRRTELGWDTETVGTSVVRFDEVAFLAGLAEVGADLPGSTAAWLVEWLKDEGFDPRQLLKPYERSDKQVATALADGAPIVVAGSMLRIFEAACRLAKRTVDRDRADLRHVVFALLDERPDSLGLFNTFMTFDRLLQLRARLIDRITASPEAGEDVKAWRELLRPKELVSTLSDAPATGDSLGRQAFADVLAARIRDVWATLQPSGVGGDCAFILHMDGAWGSGKSSILNFLKVNLESSKPKWLVVEFNAWRNQHRKPAWLPLILEVRSAATRRWAPRVWLVWFWWRLRMDWLPYLIALVLISLAAGLVWWAGLTATSGLKDAGEAFKALGAIIATVASCLAVARGFSLGSHRNADAYLETKSEPFRRIIRLFRWLIAATRRPVALLIDDLDRCDSSYVIELLEGIQTSLRSAPVVYVVAGDRKWIASSFDQRYADFGAAIGTPGRPLGYLFLDKVFQLSTSIPQLSAVRQEQYWRQLLNRDAASIASRRPARARIEAESAGRLDGKLRQEDIQGEIDKTPEGSDEREALLAAAARQTATVEAMRVAEHRLQPLAHLLEANPRSMKRLVNAYGLNQARAFLEDRKVSVETLARWTIVELRWPLLADYLAANWPEIASGALRPESFPPAIREWLDDAEVRAVVGGPDQPGQLTVASLRPLLD